MTKEFLNGLIFIKIFRIMDIVVMNFIFQKWNLKKDNKEPVGVLNSETPTSREPLCLNLESHRQRSKQQTETTRTWIINAITSRIAFGLVSLNCMHHGRKKHIKLSPEVRWKKRYRQRFRRSYGKMRNFKFYVSGIFLEYRHPPFLPKRLTFRMLLNVFLKEKNL